MNSKNLRHACLLVAVSLIAHAGAARAYGSDHEGSAGHDHGDHAKMKTTEATVEGTPDAKSEAEIIAEQLPYYPLDTCVVSHHELDAMGEPTNLLHDGKLVRICCDMCEERFAADPESYVARIDAAVIESQMGDYPLDTCLISGRKLGAMGEPYDHVEGMRLVRFCCEMCLPDFRENPAEHLARIEAARGES
jgi:YHS domain-containing protein